MIDKIMLPDARYRVIKTVVHTYKGLPTAVFSAGDIVDVAHNDEGLCILFSLDRRRGCSVSEEVAVASLEGYTSPVGDPAFLAEMKRIDAARTQGKWALDYIDDGIGGQLLGIETKADADFIETTSEHFPAMLAELRRLNAEVLSLQGMRAEGSALTAENERLRGEIAALKAENDRLRGRAAIEPYVPPTKPFFDWQQRGEHVHILYIGGVWWYTVTDNLTDSEQGMWNAVYIRQGRIWLDPPTENTVDAAKAVAEAHYLAHWGTPSPDATEVI